MYVQITTMIVQNVREVQNLAQLTNNMSQSKIRVDQS